MRASDGNVKDFVLSTSTSSQTIKKVCTKMFDQVRKDFKALEKDKFVSIHWDEKPIQEEILLHLSILQFFKPSQWTKLLETTSLEKGTGENHAEGSKSI